MLESKKNFQIQNVKKVLILVIAKMVTFGSTMDVEQHLLSLLSVKTSEKLVDSLLLHVISVNIICW